MVNESEETPLLRIRCPEDQHGEEASSSRLSAAKANACDGASGHSGGSCSSRVGFAGLFGKRDRTTSSLPRVLAAAVIGAAVLVLAVGMMSTSSTASRAGDANLSATAVMPDSAASASPSGDDAAAAGGSSASGKGGDAHVNGLGRDPSGVVAGRSSGVSVREEGGTKEARMGWRDGRDRSSDASIGGEDSNGKAAEAARGGGSGSVRSTSTSKPNIFFFLIDDMGFADIGYQATDLADFTPTLDSLAASGVKLTNYYTMSLCTPARASIMTGRYPVRYGMQYAVIEPGMPYGLPLNEKIMPEYLNEAGYESHMVGKWHLGSHAEGTLPNRRGFETYLGYLNGVNDYYTHVNPEISLNGRNFFDLGFGNSTGYYDITRPGDGACYDAQSVPGGDADGEKGVEAWGLARQECLAGKYSTDVFIGRAQDIVKSKSPVDDRPLFLYLAHQAVHSPTGPAPADQFTAEEQGKLDALEASTGSLVRAQFAGVVMMLDKRIRAFVEMLELEGWLENSVIIVASDNGACPLDGGSNYPLRGTKQSMFEGGTKVPAFVWSKSHLPLEVWGTSYSNLMHSTDWLPTLASMIGLEISGSAGALDGVSHWDSIKSNGVGGGGNGPEDPPRTEILHNWDGYLLSSANGIAVENRALAQGAFRSGDWKLLTNTWCSGYYSHDPRLKQMDGLLKPSVTCEGVRECVDCIDQCQLYPSLYNVYPARLYNIKDDPREEHDLIHQFPEIAKLLHDRAEDVVYSEYTESGLLPINNQSKLVFRKHGWYLLPWMEELAEWETEQTLNGFM